MDSAYDKSILCAIKYPRYEECVPRMKIAICDDSLIHNQKLHQIVDVYLSQDPGSTYQISPFTSGVELTRIYRYGMFDLIFLDVEMPELSGFETAQKIRSIDLDVDIIFVTYMADYISTGYHYNAKQYLCKPIKDSDIVDLMNRLTSERQRKTGGEVYSIQARLGERQHDVHLRISEIVYFESDDKYVNVYTDKHSHTFREKITTVEADMKNKGNTFIRIHQPYLVNIEHIFKNFSDKIVLRNGQSLPISKKYKDSVNNTLRGRWL